MYQLPVQEAESRYEEDSRAKKRDMVIAAVYHEVPEGLKWGNRLQGCSWGPDVIVRNIAEFTSR